MPSILESKSGFLIKYVCAANLALKHLLLKCDCYY